MELIKLANIVNSSLQKYTEQEYEKLINYDERQDSKLSEEDVKIMKISFKLNIT